MQHMANAMAQTLLLLSLSSTKSALGSAIIHGTYGIVFNARYEASAAADRAVRGRRRLAIGG